jgi:hypothetical protein
MIKNSPRYGTDRLSPLLPVITTLPLYTGRRSSARLSGMLKLILETTSVGNNIILQYIALFGAYYISAILRIAISY